MLTKCQYRGAAVVVGMTSREYATVKKVCFQSGTEAWQRTGGANVIRWWVPDVHSRLAVSVRVHGTERREASVDRRDRVITWRCRSSSMYGGTELDRTLIVHDDRYFALDALLYKQPVKKLYWRGHICAADRWPGRRCIELSAASRRLQQERHTAVRYSSRSMTRLRCRRLRRFSIVRCSRTCRRARVW